MASDEWLLRWPNGADGIVEVYHNHRWWDTFPDETAAREELALLGREPGN